MLLNKNIVLWFITLYLAGTVNPLISKAGGDTPKTILYVNSYHPGYAWSDGILDGIQSVLKTHKDVRLIVEYLYTKSHHSEVYFQKVKEVFREKFRKENVHVIITSDDHALDFVLGLKKELFLNIPLIFCGVDHVTPERIAGHDMIYEIKQGKSTQGTIDMALLLQPEATEIYFIGDRTKTGETIIEGALQLEPYYGKRLAFHYLQDNSEKELAQKLRQISGDAIVIYLTFLKDKNGKKFTLEKSMTMVSENSKAPVYCTWGFQPELGIVGGAIMNGFKQGEFSLKVALQIVGSNSLDHIPKTQTAPLDYMIDYSTLQSHGLAFDSLPEIKTVFNRPPSIYHDYLKYRTVVWMIVAIILNLILFVFFLRDRNRKLAAINKNLKSEIDKRKQMAEALKESEKKFRTFFMLGKVGMAITSPEKGWIKVNNQLCNMLGYSEDELRDMNWAELTHPEDLPQDEVQFNRVIQGEQDGYSLDKRFIRKDGRTLHTTLWLACLRKSSGEVEHFIAHLSDNSERIKAEKENSFLQVHLRQQQKLESIGTLAGGVAHEINNPINGIMNYAQLIKDKSNPGSPTEEFAREIIHETERISSIVRNLLTFARADKNAHNPVKLTDIIYSTMSLIRTVVKHDQIILEVDVPEDLPKIKCRSQQIQQVIMNLLTNAKDALNDRYPGYNENKKIIISSRLFQKEGKRWIRTTVEDHGSGIEEKARERLFDPFFTTKPREIGTGLGLSIGYGIVKDHHGELKFESRADQYTRFHMDLPVDKAR